jgi:hypothetical protein
VFSSAEFDFGFISSGRSVRVLGTASLALLFLILAACGGGAHPTSSTSNALSGNWQLVLFQEYPGPKTTLSISGFLAQADDAITGSVQAPSEGTKNLCGGVSPLSGTINGQNVAFSVNEAGTVFSFTGAISSDNQSMSGDYQAQGGACFIQSTTGTWNAFLVPPLNGNFTGTIDSSYVGFLQTGVASSTGVPIPVSGSIAQSSNGGASNATLTGTINAVGYPCFATASLTGTISGQNVYMDVFDYNGEQIGTLGVPQASPGIAGTPATVMTTASGMSLVGDGQAGLALGNGAVDPCPPLAGESNPGDVANVALTFQ